MVRRKRTARRSARRRRFDALEFLTTGGLARRIVEYRAGDEIFTQGQPCRAVMYLQKGRVKLSVLSKGGREAVVAILDPGEFFGEGALAGQPLRMATATAMAPSTVLEVQKSQMDRLLREQRGLADRFIAHLLARNIRVEEDLVDQLFNSSEKRLARALILLARYGRREQDTRVVPKVPQDLLAEIVGTTRSRVNVFMNKFRRLGLIDYNGTLTVHDSLVTLILSD